MLYIHLDIDVVFHFWSQNFSLNSKSWNGSWWSVVGICTALLLKRQLYAWKLFLAKSWYELTPDLWNNEVLSGGILSIDSHLLNSPILFSWVFISQFLIHSVLYIFMYVYFYFALNIKNNLPSLCFSQMKIQTSKNKLQETSYAFILCNEKNTTL